MMKWKSFFVLTFIGVYSLFCLPAFGQQGFDIIKRVYTANTAVPFLRITPDARSGAMGNVGVAVSPDAYANFHNPSKLAFTEKQMGMYGGYTPWLRELVSDVHLFSFGSYYRFDDQQAVGLSARYFSMGTLHYTDRNGEKIEYNPNEFALDATYARKLSDKFSTGITLRFIYSDFPTGQPVSGVQSKPATAAAADISLYYTKNVSDIVNFAAGLNISNLGNKITYTQSAIKDFLPANMGLGTNLTLNFSKDHNLNFAFDVNKLLAPTPTEELSSDSTTLAYLKKSVPAGVLGSFSDAPGGFQEEMREFNFSFGVEYWCLNHFAIRSGYFWEHATKGNRKFFTAGLGVKYSIFGLDFSYLVPTTSQRHPLDNVMRFTLKFDFNVSQDQNQNPGDNAN